MESVGEPCKRFRERNQAGVGAAVLSGDGLRELALITQLKGEHAVACRDRYDLLSLALITDRIRSNDASKVLPPNLPTVSGVEGKEMTFVAAPKNQLPGR